MIFVLEGPDGVGKTTLAKMLVKKVDGIYLHLGYRWKHKIFDYHTAAIRLAARSKKPVIIDRWWPSEAIYSKVFRNGSRWPLQGRMCDRIAKKFGVIHILCLPESVEAAARKHDQLKQARTEMYDDITDVAALYFKLWHGDTQHEATDTYLDYLIRTGGVKDRVDWISYSIHEWGHCMDLFVDRAIELSQVYREHQFPPALLYQNWNMLGHIHEAKYLFLGEQVNAKHRELFWPFYEYGNSSLFLSQCLHKINFNEGHGMWANVLDHDGKDNALIGGLLNTKLHNLKVVTFGGRALGWSRAMNIPVYAELPHPSYAKRFRKVDLVEILKHAICE